jgi:hypothetical protein
MKDWAPLVANGAPDQIPVTARFPTGAGDRPRDVCDPKPQTTGPVAAEALEGPGRLAADTLAGSPTLNPDRSMVNNRPVLATRTRTRSR